MTAQIKAVAAMSFKPLLAFAAYRVDAFEGGRLRSQKRRATVRLEHRIDIRQNVLQQQREQNAMRTSKNRNEEDNRTPLIKD